MPQTPFNKSTPLTGHCLSSLSLSSPAWLFPCHDSGSHFRPLGPIAPAPVVPEQSQSPAPPSPALPGRGLHQDGPGRGPSLATAHPNSCGGSWGWGCLGAPWCQQAEGCDPAPLLSSAEAEFGELCPVLGSSIQEIHEVPGVGPMESY